MKYALAASLWAFALAPLLMLSLAASGDPSTRTWVSAPPKISVTVDWINVPDGVNAFPIITAGPGYDARLLATLRASGVQDTPGPQVMTTEGRLGSIHLRREVPTTVMENGVARKTTLHLDTYTEVLPRMNPDGTISVDGRVQRAFLAPGVDPPAADVYLSGISSTLRFRSGKPLLVGKLGDRVPVFVTVTVLTPQKDASVR